MRFASLFLLNSLIILSASAQTEDHPRYKTMGLDMEILSYGGSLGGFYAYHISPGVSLNVAGDWTIVQAKDSFSYYTYYGQPVTINNYNLSFVKLLAGASWYPFLESMHSSVQFGFFGSAGPLISLNTADDEALLDRWQDVSTDVTATVRAGLELRVMSGVGAFYIFQLGYDYAHFDRLIDTRQTYKGLFFQAGMEFLRR